MSFCAACGAASNAQGRNTTKPNKGKGKGKGKSGPNSTRAAPPQPSAKQVETQVKDILTKAGVLPAKTYVEALIGKAPASEEKLPTQMEIEQEETPAPECDPKWLDLSIPQLKQEHSQLTSLSMQLEKAGLAEASQQARLKATQLHDYMVSKRSSGQQLDTFTSAVRKATAALERQSQHVQDLDAKLAEAKKKQVELEQAEVAAKQALTDFQKRVVPAEETPLPEESSLTDASAKFVSAILPKELPLQQQQALQIQINQALGAIMTQINLAVNAEQARTEHGSAPPTPVMPPTPQLETQPATPAAIAAAGIANQADGRQETLPTQIESAEQQTGFGKASIAMRVRADHNHSHTVIPRHNGMLSS